MYIYHETTFQQGMYTHQKIWAEAKKHKATNKIKLQQTQQAIRQWAEKSAHNSDVIK